MSSAALKSPVRRARPERLEARVSADQKALFQRAADLSGRNLTDFIVTALQSAATVEIERHAMLKLAADDSAAFVDAVLNPPAPNAALRKAAKRYTAAAQ
ncbi:MAG: DUF1778 domain-containing protein [Parvularculaceae bacterium]